MSRRNARAMWSALGTLILITALAAGCGGSSAPAAPTAAPKAAAPTAAAPAAAPTSAPAAPAAAAPAKVIEMKVDHSHVETHPHHYAWTVFSQEIGKLTNGAIKVTIFPNNQLGSLSEVVTAMQANTVQGADEPTSFMTGVVPELSLFDLSYLFKDVNHMLQVADGPLGAKVLNTMPTKGLRVIGTMNAGTWNIYNSKKPLKTADDVKGMKIRTMSSQPLVESINLLGGSGVAMNPGEVYSAIQQKVVDGSVNSLVMYNDAKHYEVAKYFSKNNLWIIPDMLVISEKFYQSLTPDQQKAVLQAGKVAADAERVKWLELEKNVEAELKGKGAEINEVDTNQESFRKAMEPLYAKFADKAGGMELIKEIRGK